MNKKEICLKTLIRKIVTEEIGKEKLKALIASKTENELKEQYIPYGLTHSFCGFGSYLFENENGKYASLNKRYSVPLDRAKQEITIKYGLKDWQFTIRKQYGNVEIGIVIADIDDNAKMIERDMKQMGYFVGHYYKVKATDGTNWLQMQFEPKYQKELEIIKKRRLMLVHITPFKNIEDIRKKGFIPSSKNEFFSYPDRVYFYYCKNDLNELLQMVDYRYLSNGWGDERYCTFLIDSSKVPNNVSFFADPNMENGIYTYDNVPYNTVFQEIVIDMSKMTVLSTNNVN
jgi:hypothetical protein